MPSIHATAVLVGARAVLIRGPSGSGKSRLAAALLFWAHGHPARFARLIGDDRVHLEAAGGRLLARGAPELASLIERHGLGLASLPAEPRGLVGMVVDLAAPDAARMPEAAALATTVEGVVLPRLPLSAGFEALPLVLARCSWLGAAVLPHGQADR